jgi:hypothetical protein
LMARSFEVPKILVRTLSKNTSFSVYRFKCHRLQQAARAGFIAHIIRATIQQAC